MKTMTFRQPVLAATALLMPFTTFAQEGNKKRNLRSSAPICVICVLWGTWQKQLRNEEQRLFKYLI